MVLSENVHNKEIRSLNKLKLLICTSETQLSFHFTAHLDEDPHVFQVFSLPLVEGLQKLQAVAGWAHVHLNKIKSELDYSENILFFQMWERQLEFY